MKQYRVKITGKALISLRLRFGNTNCIIHMKELTDFECQVALFLRCYLSVLVLLSCKGSNYLNSPDDVIVKLRQRLKGRDVITTPKTPKSNRVIKMPRFLSDVMQYFLKTLYGIEPMDRIFTITKYYLHHEMDRGSKAARIKRIRIHDLRHSHISLLIDMGFSAIAIALEKTI